MTYTMDFRATIESVGDWQGREEYASRRWNANVAPTLQRLSEKLTEDQQAYMQQDAWEAFCSPAGSAGAVAAAKRWA